MVRSDKSFFQRIILPIKNEKEMIDKNFLFSIVLEEVAFRIDWEKEDFITVGFLRHRISSKLTWSLICTPVAKIDLWIGEMATLGLINIKSDKNTLYIRYRDDGKKALQQQTFHQIYANLSAARQSRILSSISIFIAFLVFLLNIIL